jgi:N-acetylmuramoyl-L-alanine amidase
MQSAKAACRTLCNPDNEVSAHYLIAEDGTVIQMVAEESRAWHAGAGSWGGVVDVNSRSIGIELANPGNCPFAAAQIDALVELLAGIQSRWNIKPERFIGHSDMAPGRKIDPGARFDWRRLSIEGFGMWPTTLPMLDEPISNFAKLVQLLGYTAEASEDVLLHSFRLRFRPNATGPLDANDMAILHNLAMRFPVDAKTP